LVTIPKYTNVQFQKEAYQTWKDFYEPQSESGVVRNYVNGTLSCFCNDEYQKFGLQSAFKYYREDGLDQLPSGLLDNVLDKEEELGKTTSTRQICKSYVMYQKLNTYYYLLMTIMILIYNSLFYTFTTPVVQMIGYHTKTEENILTSQAIIACLTIDMIILPIMIGTNLVEYGKHLGPLSSLSFFYSGKHTDFGAEWYPDVGY
jgi:hypothetical protein